MCPSINECRVGHAMIVFVYLGVAVSVTRFSLRHAQKRTVVSVSIPSSPRRNDRRRVQFGSDAVAGCSAGTAQTSTGEDRRTTEGPRACVVRSCPSAAPVALLPPALLSLPPSAARRQARRGNTGTRNGRRTHHTRSTRAGAGDESQPG